MSRKRLGLLKMGVRARAWGQQSIFGKVRHMSYNDRQSNLI